MPTKATKLFLISFSAILAFLIVILTYYAVTCQEIAKMHSEPQLDAAFKLFMLGVLSATTFACINYFREHKIWFLIPTAFACFAILLLFTIVECPVWAQF